MAYKIKDRLHFLSEGSKILSSSLDYYATLKIIARLVVTHMADFCVIDLVQNDGPTERVAVKTANKKYEKFAQSIFKYQANPKNKGGIYDVIRFGKPILVKHATDEWRRGAARTEDERKNLKKIDLRSFIFVPLKSRSKIIGVLTIISIGDKFAYSKDDLTLAEELASRAGIAIDKARLFSETQEAAKIMEDVYVAGTKLLVPLTVEETSAMIVKEAQKLVKAPIGSISLYQDKKLKRTYASHKKLYEIVPRRGGNTHKALHNQQPIIIEGDKNNSEFVKLGIQSTALIPLLYKKRPMGVLSINSLRRGHFTKKHLEILKLFGSVAALAIRKTQLFDQARAAIQTRDLFISMAAHEFRTPLTTINGYIQLLQKKPQNLNQKEKQWIDYISGETNRLTKLVNELLEVNRIKTGKLQYKWRACSLKEILERASAAFQMNHPSYKLTVQNLLDKKDDAIVGDPDKLLQALINVLDNAAKFSPEGSTIDASLSRKNAHFMLSVKDQGRGIQKEELPKIFEGFYQGRQYEERGMGLGLYLAKNILKEHHGAINVKSKPNKGTVVEIKLPQLKK